MSYRSFSFPSGGRAWNTDEWVQWLRDQNVAPSVKADEIGTCSLCRAPTPIGSRGTHYDKCYNCRDKYSGVLDGLVPICYSLQSGLEGALWRAKNDPNGAWLRMPLGSLLCTFLAEHQSCIESRYGGAFDLLIAMPSHASTRGGHSHLDSVIDIVQDFDTKWSRGLLSKTDASKAVTRRAEIVPGLFSATSTVRGKRVLLFDDTFTTGGSLVSAAYALKQEGATSVVGLTLGRQLRADWPHSSDFVAMLSGRTLEISECAVHDSWFAALGRPF